MADILVVAAHPDDEVLGCGGAIARHVAQGDRVRVVIMAEGLTSRTDSRNSPELAELNLAAQKANAILGVSELRLMGLPDNRLDTLDRLSVIQKIESVIDLWRPSVIYTHHAGDVNVDHQVVHHAVVTACRPQRSHPVSTLLFFEVPSSTEWQTPGSGEPYQPNWFVDISDSLERKLQALTAYSGEMRGWPHPRSLQGVEYLARWRGATIGANAAEAFVLGRQVQRIERN